MAIKAETIRIHEQMFRNLEPGSSLMILGRPTLMWENAPTPEEYFRGFGFGVVHTLDVSPYQGASHIHDLNLPDPPRELEGRYDVVMSGGTLEHVFCISNAFKTAASMVKEGGWLWLSTPVNNWVDHGFYQVSPTMNFDYLAENRFECGISRVTIRHGDYLRSFPFYPREGHTLNHVKGRVSHVMRAQKVAGTTFDRIPTQSVYLDKHSNETRKYRFAASEPLEHQGGAHVVSAMKRFPLEDLRALDGRYAAKFLDPKHPPSLPGRPFRSPALVYENGKLLKWIVSEAAMVKERPSSFFHGPGFIHFSTPDGTDPRENGRSYQVAFPNMKALLSSRPLSAAQLE
jgi:hypothetical protein